MNTSQILDILIELRRIFVAHRYTATKICPTEAAVRDSVEAYKECADDTNRAMASSIRDELIKGDP